MGELIDADKLLDKARVGGNITTYSELAEWVESGILKPDPIPLPTIKPGDKTHSAGWYCSICNVSVLPQHVTYQEEHDVRAGGCGGHVEWLEVSHD